MDGDPDTNEMKSSEEMRSKFEDYNKNVAPEIKKRAFVTSMDAKSLYPSIKKSVAREAIVELVNKSDLTIKNVDYWEGAKYIAILCSAEEIREAGLSDIIPRRTTRATRQLTLNCLFTRGDNDKWIPGQDPDDAQKKMIISLVLCAANEEIMSNHIYKVGDILYRQSDGAPAGSEYAGIIARAVTRMFDSRYLRKTAERGLNVLMYGRYIDDIDQVIEKEFDEDDEKTTSEKFKAVANECCDNIVWEDDIPSGHPGAKLPILDMQVWLRDDGVLLYQHYEKPVSSKQVLSVRSAHSSQGKRAVHINEIVRRMLNCSPQLSWAEAVVPILEEYMRRMSKAGYSESYRHDVLTSAVNIYEKKLKDDADGTCPLNRPSPWLQKSRET